MNTDSKIIKNISFANQGQSAWHELSPKRQPRPMLDHDTTADWVIIGGGFAGLHAAKRLRELAPKDKILLLDAMAIGEGAAGRNSGIMIELPHGLTDSHYEDLVENDPRPMINALRHAINYASDMIDLCGISG